MVAFFASIAVSLVVNFILFAPPVSANPRTAMVQALEGAQQKTSLDPRAAMYFQIEYAAAHYRVSHQGRAPQSLNELVPAYFDTVPIDPLTGQPFPTPISMGGDGMNSKPGTGSPGTPGGPTQVAADGYTGPSIDLSPPCPLGLVRHPTAGVCVTPRKTDSAPSPSPTPTPTQVRDSRRD